MKTARCEKTFFWLKYSLYKYNHIVRTPHNRYIIIFEMWSVIIFSLNKNKHKKSLYHLTKDSVLYLMNF
jgi:hypothetical protein